MEGVDIDEQWVLGSEKRLATLEFQQAMMVDSTLAVGIEFIGGLRALNRYEFEGQGYFFQ